jgi:ABC-2 type transport system permease protein
MARFKTLLQLNIKRTFRALPQLIFGATALIFLVSAVAFCGNKFLYGTLSEISTQNKFPVGIIMEDDSKIAKTVADALLNMKAVNENLDINFTEKETAIEMLKAGEIIAAIHIPKDTAHGIMTGANTPMTIIFPEDSGFEAIIIKELADSVTNMLSSAQAGIYSIYDFYDENEAADQIDAALLRMNLKYINIAATGNGMFDKTVVTASGSVPLMTYYICGALVLFILLFGINCFNCQLNLSSYSSKSLSLHGTPLIAQGLSSYIATALGQLTAIAIVATPAAFIMKMFKLKLEGPAIMGLILTIPIFILISSSFVYLIASITEHVTGQIMITFFATIVMCFISGCFIPTAMLPDILKIVSKFMPAYYMINYSSSFLSGSFDGVSLLICLSFAIILFLLGLLVSHQKRRKELC